jgi:Na+/melibiose symporter-like transporter
MTPYQMTCIILITIASLFYLLFFLWVRKNYLHAKNKAKQEAKERAAINKLFNEAPSGSVHGSYEDFNETELGATSL